MNNNFSQRYGNILSGISKFQIYGKDSNQSVLY